MSKSLDITNKALFFVVFLIILRLPKYPLMLLHYIVHCVQIVLHYIVHSKYYILHCVQWMLHYLVSLLCLWPVPWAEVFNQHPSWEDTPIDFWGFSLLRGWHFNDCCQFLPPIGILQIIQFTPQITLVMYLFCNVTPFIFLTIHKRKLYIV